MARSVGGLAFSVTVSHGKADKAGPRAFARCLSCEPEAATLAENNYPGGEGGRGPPGGLPDRLRRRAGAPPMRHAAARDARSLHGHARHWLLCRHAALRHRGLSHAACAEVRRIGASAA